MECCTDTTEWVAGGDVGIAQIDIAVKVFASLWYEGKGPL